MKIKIKSFNGELPKYLTIDKAYKVIQVTKKGNISIRNDKNSVLWVSRTNCSTLNGGSWINV